MITHAWRTLTLRGTEVILCLLCNRYSADPRDIAERFCSHCRVWLASVPEDFRQEALTPQGPATESRDG